MALDLRDCEFFGPALPEPFVKFDLEQHLNRANLLAKGTGAEGRQLQERWEIYRRKLRELVGAGGDRRVYNNVLEPLVEQLGYARSTKQSQVSTREGMEDGGWLFESEDGKARLRVWSVGLDTDIDAPSRRGRAYRFSWSRIAQRVLLAKGERVGLLTNGEELRLLVCDPARPDSHVTIRLDQVGGWRARRTVPDSYRLVLALASPAGMTKLTDLIEAARLAQTKVTKELRSQARAAIEGFIQQLLDHPQNTTALAVHENKQALARQLWQEGLILVYRLLFIFKLESSADAARAFSFATVALWRQTYSPNQALGPFVRDHLDKGYDTGRILEDGLRTVFRLFQDGLQSRELVIKPLGGMLFGKDVTPLLDSLSWGERATAILLDRLLWTTPKGRQERERVHYGPLDVEDLGRVYEALIELDPGIAAEPMSRLRRAKLEVVLPAARAIPYRPADVHAAVDFDDRETDEDGDDTEDEDESRGRGKTKVQWVEDIPAGRFYLRVGLGRKASGSYYTPHPFVRFLVQETLSPQVEERSPTRDPEPGELLKLKVLDPAMGSGHFLVEACRYLGEALYEACRLCDELASAAEREAEGTEDESERERLLEHAIDLRQRVADLPDPDDELVAYLPSRAVEGGESGLSQARAMALCRRLVAVHCLYGVDKNQLAVELAKLSLWLESFAEGLPLTFLDHRLLCGDSITGPFFEHILTHPVSGQSLDNLFARGLTDRLHAILTEALVYVRDLEASVGKDVAELEQKRAANAKLDGALKPLKQLARVWSGAVMRGEPSSDLSYAEVAEAVSEGRPLLNDAPAQELIDTASDAIAYDLVFPEVFHPGGEVKRVGGFDAVVSNPPWDALQPKAKEFFAAFDLAVLDAPTRRERASVEKRVKLDPAVAALYDGYVSRFEKTKRLVARVYNHVNREAHGQPSGAVTDVWQVFAERGHALLAEGAGVGWILPSAFHANQSATGIRELYLKQARLSCCYSFENKHKLFEIHSSFKFAAIVAFRDQTGTEQFFCAFYLHELNWLFSDRDRLTYTCAFLEATGRQYYSLVELRTQKDVDIVAKFFAGTEMFSSILDRLNIKCGEEVHMTKSSAIFENADTILQAGLDCRDPGVTERLVKCGYLILHEGKTFHQYTDHWEDPPRYLIPIEKVRDKLGWLKAARYYRLVLRAVASSTNERTGFLTLLPPGMLCGHSAPPEKYPWKRSTSSGLYVSSVASSFCFDFALRQKTSANVSFYILENTPYPTIDQQVERFLAHATLRLTCNHIGYAPLWREQVGDVWREATPVFTWPVLAGEHDRWQLRAAIDAVVARAYGLDRADYEHVLASFSHRGYPRAPELCLAMFDELQSIGPETFTSKYDPYRDIPLVTALPKPVIEIPGFEEDPLRSRSTMDRSGQISLLPADHGPLFQERGAAASPSSPRPANGDLDRETYELIELLLEEKGAIASSDAQDLTGLDAATVRPYLQQLVDEGKARADGQRRGTRYHRVPYGKA